jgi:hypothetical protein
MTVINPILYPSGDRYGVVFELDQTTGLIKATSASTPYTGMRFVGKKAFALQIPKFRKIYHIDADRVGVADFLPPTEGASATINASADDFNLDALISGNTAVTIGEAKQIASLSSNQGYEPVVGLFLFQQAIDHINRLRAWRSFLVPRAKVVQQSSGMGDREIDTQYDCVLIPSTTTILGVSLATNIDGATDAQLFRLASRGRPAIAAWKGDGYVTDFNLEQPAGTAAHALSTDKIAVYKNGVVVTVGITKAVDKVSFNVAPTSSDTICIFWEY